MTSLYTGEISCILNRMFNELSNSSSFSKFPSYVHPVFKGVFAFDEIPSLNDFDKTSCPFCMVINCDPSTKTGSHWICIYVNPIMNTIEFFDSYGCPPTLYNFAFPHSLSILCSTLCLQSEFTFVCGHYCILFLVFRAFPNLFHKFNSKYIHHTNPHSMDSVLTYFENLAKTEKIRDRKIALHIKTLNQIFPCYCHPSLNHSSCILNQSKTWQSSLRKLIE